MKKIGKWILVAIIIPLLKDVLKDVLISVTKYFVDWIKEKMKEWREKEMSDSKTENEKEKIKEKWDDRIKDIDNMKSTLSNSIGKIVDKEMAKSEQKVKTIEINGDATKQVSHETTKNLN